MQVADDEKGSWPRAAAILKRELYADNLLTSVDTLHDILKIRNEVIHLLSRGGFNIRQ